MLLYVEDENGLHREIVACEIKCIVSLPIDNTSYRRAESLATRQLESCIEIIGDKEVCHRGVIVICYVYQDSKKNYVFDTRACLIQF